MSCDIPGVIRGFIRCTPGYTPANMQGKLHYAFAIIRFFRAGSKRCPKMTAGDLAVYSG